jgi:hypothetical protein
MNKLILKFICKSVKDQEEERNFAEAERDERTYLPGSRSYCKATVMETA